MPDDPVAGAELSIEALTHMIETFRTLARRLDLQDVEQANEYRAMELHVCVLQDVRDAMDPLQFMKAAKHLDHRASKDITIGGKTIAYRVTFMIQVMLLGDPHTFTDGASGGPGGARPTHEQNHKLG